ncbi:MAG: dienelactone hydrolase family protein [Myxococcales bacterium]|nr:dienelactone hydrolase family protein [Myxococcales bacterium]MCB9749233.1 dienelactone hydrolase family protein [Myxococcales bacterium]
MHTEHIDYKHGDATLQALLAREGDASAPRPGVLVAHAWGGRDAFADGKARALAELGYVGFALDMYGKGVRGTNVAENSALMKPLMQDRGLLRARLRAGLETLRAQPGVDASKVAIMGFCFGGLCALDLARSGADILGAVSFHGLLTPSGGPNEPIQARVLALHGYDDPMVPPDRLAEFQQEMTASGADWQVHAYGGTVHAFTVPEANNAQFGTVYNERAARRSWRSAVDFFAEIFS